MGRSVVVTGVGAITPLGDNASTTWSALLAGTSGMRTLEWANDLPVTFAGVIQSDLIELGIEKAKARKLDRSQQFAVLTAREAWADAGLSEVDQTRLGVCYATGIGGVTSLLEQSEVLRNEGPRFVSPMTVPMLMPNGPAAWIGLEFKAQAGVHTPVSACASGAEAVAWGARMIQDNRADVVIVGGTEAAITRLTISAFASMRALSKRNDDPTHASRPYDTDRDGFVMGEGAGTLILESEEYAKARGAKIYARYGGVGMTSDGHDIAQPHPEGAGAIRAIQFALKDAALSASDITHVNAHATSTPLGDVAEALALRTALGAHASNVIVSGTKSMTGHLLGGAGAIESVFSVLALHHRIAPPTINIENLESDLGIDVAVNTSRPLPEGNIAALNNSFGFGGHDVAVIFTSN
ncbi:MAG: beta-ketoacyl-[acyl-carrier-protein] synthase family protein [Candidatus Nanopelagicales bacterium]